MSEARFSFDAVAEKYDRIRPGYPEALFDAVVKLSGIPDGGRILEIGCGTGQATRALARRGHRILGLEPGASLAALARARLAEFPRVEIVELTFEAWPLEKASVDLVVSAQAFHWVDPELRFAKAAAALRPGGALAVIGNVAGAHSIREELDAAYEEHAPTLAHTSPMSWYSPGGPFAQLFAAESARFGPVAHRVEPWTQSYTAPDYVELLETFSDHRLLPAAQRQALHAAIRAVVERAGGSIRVGYDAHLHLARVPATIS
jgi:SAM-dependent methyltransferase